MALSHIHAPGVGEVDAAHPVDALVLGAGPAGLAIGHELKKRGASVLILERGEGVGDTWRRMPSNLKLVSPWKSNSLPGTEAGRLPGNHEMSSAEFHSYLQAYAAEQELPIRTSVQVATVVQDADGVFEARTRSEIYRGRCLVNATGGMSKPFIPRFDGAGESTIPQLHVADYRDPDQLRRVVGKRPGPVLIVGKRLSAGQTLVELVGSGFEVALSHRSKIQFGYGPFLNWLYFRMLPWIEAVKLNVLGHATCGFEVTMDGGRARQLIRNGTVRTYPDINRFQGGSILFKDGTRLKPAAVIYATGFRPTLEHLHALLGDAPDRRRLPPLTGMESATVPGLFFIGLENQRNLRSHYLRGIREDAAIVADEVVQRLHWMERRFHPSPVQTQVA